MQPAIDPHDVSEPSLDVSLGASGSSTGSTVGGNRRRSGSGTFGAIRDVSTAAPAFKGDCPSSPIPGLLSSAPPSPVHPPQLDEASTHSMSSNSRYDGARLLGIFMCVERMNYDNAL